MPTPTASAPTSAPPPASAGSPALRSFARFRLLRLLGKSDRTMAWMVADPRSGHDLMLVLPRVQTPDEAAAQRWTQAVRKAARLQHPQLATPLEIGVHDNWPFAAYDTAAYATLADRIGNLGLPATEAVAAMCKALEALAYAHDAGVGHHDVQPYLVLVDDQGGVCLAGLEVAIHAPHQGTGAAPARGSSGVELGALRAQREAAERDVLGAGLVLHHALTGQPALGERDVGRVIDRLPPTGNEVVRLPFSIQQTVSDALRTIANRATDRQARQRYRSARTFGRALEGWLKSDENSGAGPLAMLLDRLANLGTLPAAKGGSERAARLALMGNQRTNELAAVVIEDLALAFELLRLVNGAQVRGVQVSGAGPVLTVRRAIAMLGLDGVRRAALGLRTWPGPLAEGAAEELNKLMIRVKRAGRIAMALRPAGFDAEVVYLITLLQNLGRLVVLYHCPEEAQQIQRLMMPMPPERAGEAPQPGMTEEAAALSVLGVDIDAIGMAITKRWGLDETAVPPLRRLPLSTALHGAQGDDDLLRASASCANELADLQGLPPGQQGQALQKIAQRYGRLLNLTAKDLQTAMQTAATSSTAAVLRAASGNAMYSVDNNDSGEVATAA